MGVITRAHARRAAALAPRLRPKFNKRQLQAMREAPHKFSARQIHQILDALKPRIRLPPLRRAPIMLRLRNHAAIARRAAEMEQAVNVQPTIEPAFKVEADAEMADLPGPALVAQAGTDYYAAIANVEQEIEPEAIPTRLSPEERADFYYHAAINGTWMGTLTHRFAGGDEERYWGNLENFGQEEGVQYVLDAITAINL